MSKGPYLFDEFFSSGMEESISPFLTKKSRGWGKNIPLKNAIWAAVLLLSAFLLSYYNQNLGYLILTFVYFHVGVPAIIDTFKDFRNFEINIDVLMTLAAFISILIGSGYEGALLLVLFELSHAMEHAVTDKAKGAIHNLHNLAPKRAFYIDPSGDVIEKALGDIEIGSHILVKAGEVIPLDGKVIKGASSVNLVHITGESRPVLKETNMEIEAGAINIDAALEIEVTRRAADSTLSRIIELVVQASEAKPKLQKFLDRFGKRYATTIILLTFVFAAALPLFFSLPYFGVEGSIYRALTFMIAASPCALIIGAPTAYLSSISACAKKGVLLKGGITLDALALCKAISFDKTGTLTKGELLLEKISSSTKTFSEEFALRVASSLERHVIHPIASAVQEYAKKEGVELFEIENFKTIAGYGLEGFITHDGKKLQVAFGLPEYILQKVGKEASSLQREEGEILSLLLIEKEIFTFHFQDSPREQIKEMLLALKERGLRLLMLTGDHAFNANKIAKEVGIEEIYADLRPEDKLSLVSEFSEKEGLAMVGDGVNDAPALARSTVGISMGKIGSRAAVDASDVVLLSDEVHHIGWLVQKAHKTMRVVRENLILALAVIFLASIPALLGFVPLYLAVILHEGGTLLVGLNSLRLLKK